SGCQEKSERLTRRFGDSISFAMIGPAAELLMRAAAIAISDPQKRPSRFCGRGGLGAVMAAKGIQAIVLDPSGTPAIQPQDKEQFKTLSRTLGEHVNNTPQTAKVFRKYGTAAMIDVGQGLGFLPVNNFTRGRFDQSEQINGQALYDTISSRGGDGKTSHACMPGCLVQCSNVYPDKDGKIVVSPLEYETIGLLGPNLGIGNLDLIAELNAIANDSGIDTVDSGAAIGVAMQAGLAAFGDGDAALALMKEIRQGTILGRVLGSGAETTAKVLGVYQAPTAKGQAFPAYDPRALKGLAATYATSPMGADHTAGHTIRAAVEDHHGFKGQADASRLSQIGTLQWDSLGFCYFLGTALPDLSIICELIQAMHGRVITPLQIRTLAVETLKAERNFNRKSGFGPAHDRLNEYFHLVENPDTGTVCDIPTPDIIGLMDDDKLSV
ncbi:MAG: aldehyde ferredoxin oxidoreductase, partial [Desulfofustis sp.]|nr:aldehyde ferredoxin oxidoreductase [Desulfofustis sp.]